MASQNFSQIITDKCFFLDNPEKKGRHMFLESNLRLRDITVLRETGRALEKKMKEGP